MVVSRVVVKLQRGAGGGKRVSAASQISLDADINVAADAMRAMGQVPLFQVRGDETALDDALEAAGYSIIDPVWIYSAPTADLIDGLSEQSRVYRGQFAVAAMQEIWAAGGIGPARIMVQNAWPSRSQKRMLQQTVSISH